MAERKARENAADDDAAVIVPRKANWDLKRDLAPKKAKLDRLTQQAIAEILKERLAANAAASADNGGLDIQVDGAVAAVLARSLTDANEVRE